MSEQTKIQWADDTINFWSGCTKVSDGCKNCYAETLAGRFTTFGQWGKGAPRKWHGSAVKLAFKLNNRPWVCECGWFGNEPEASAHGHPSHGNFECGVCYSKPHRRRIFSLSLGDWLDPEVPTEWLADMLHVVRLCSDVDWLLVTKRPELFAERIKSVMSFCKFNKDADMNEKSDSGKLYWWLNDWINCGSPPSNIMVLTSVENQEAADERYGELLAIPAARRGFSVEPLLGDVNLHLQHGCRGCNHPGNILVHWNEHGRCSGCDGTGQEPSGIDWVIVGGESGKNARPCNVDWICSVVKQCNAAGVPCFVKQLGGKAVMDTGTSTSDFAEKQSYLTPINLTDKKGGDMTEWPQVLRVREFYK